MDRSRADRKRRCDYDSSAYEVVDDQEEALGVQILPARRTYHDEGEYADRDPPRPAQAHILPAGCSTRANVSPRHPRRGTAWPAASPPINRHLKPGRRKTKYDKKVPPVPADDEHQQRFPPPAFTREIISRFEALDLHDSCRTDTQQRTDRKKEVASHTSGSHRAERDLTSQPVQRHSFDLDRHDAESRFTETLEKVICRQQYHEWPQTKEDHHDFVPAEKPGETFGEDDWYVGACDRADAEHALHLVNKDGAFLVRDCSITTDSEPLVLVVYHEKKVYNVKIRFIESINKFVLGTGQRSSDMFNSVADIIKFHSLFPIVLIGGRNLPGSKCPENCVLTCPIAKSDLDKLLQ